MQSQIDPEDVVHGLGASVSETCWFVWTVHFDKYTINISLKRLDMVTWIWPPTFFARFQPPFVSFHS